MDLSQIKPIKSEPFTFGPMQTKWLEALESGDYAQCKRSLKGDIGLGLKQEASGQIGYCCLGVLCEIAGLEWHEEGDDKSNYFRFGEDTSNGYLPTGFAETVGLANSWGTLKKSITFKFKGEDRTSHTLADLNDEFDQSFKDIAAYIRHDPHNVFTKSA